MALDTLRKNKLRSGLTILGITIGISTVILISSAINGLDSNIDRFIKTLGTNDLWVFRFDPWGHRLTTEELNRKQLTYEDGVAMRSLPHVVAVDPAVTYQNFQLGIGNVGLKAGSHKVQNTIIYGDTTEVKKTNDICLKGACGPIRRKYTTPAWWCWAMMPPRICSPTSPPSARMSSAAAMSSP